MDRSKIDWSYGGGGRSHHNGMGLFTGGLFTGWTNENGEYGNDSNIAVFEHSKYYLEQLKARVTSLNRQGIDSEYELAVLNALTCDACVQPRCPLRIKWCRFWSDDDIALDNIQTKKFPKIFSCVKGDFNGAEVKKSEYKVSFDFHYDNTPEIIRSKKNISVFSHTASEAAIEIQKSYPNVHNFSIRE